MDRRPKYLWGPWGPAGSRSRGLRVQALLLAALLLFGAANAADVNAVLMNGRLSTPSLFAGTGYHSIGLINHTSETAVFNVYRLARGASVDDLAAADAALQQAIDDGQDITAAFESVAEDGQALSGLSVSKFSEKELVVDLERGTYAVIATPSDGEPMWATFRVTHGGDDTTTAEPQAEYDAELSGSSFAMPAEVASGNNIWKLSNSGDQPLVVNFYRLTPGSTVDDLVAYLAGDGSGPEPYDKTATFMTVAPGATALVPLDLSIGSWVAVRSGGEAAPVADAGERADMIAAFRVE